MESFELIKQGKNFRLLEEDELPLLLEILAGYLPESIKFHQTVFTYMKHKVWNFYFYIANNWPEVPICLHFPGMTKTPNGLVYESFDIFCPTSSLDKLQLLRDENILIDWRKPLYVKFIHEDIVNKLSCLFDQIEITESVLCDVWICEEPKNMQGESDVQVEPVRLEDAEEIHKLYPSTQSESQNLFLQLIKVLPTAGIYVDGVIAAWMLQSYYGAMFSMQTKSQYRRKGFGIKILQYLMKKVRENGYIPFVLINPNNPASQALYKKFGFTRHYRTIRAKIIIKEK